MLDIIEKLINEHGSSLILKERLSLISDRYSNLEEKLQASELKFSDLESENTSLKMQLEQKEERISTLERNIQEGEKANNPNALDEVQQNILKFIFDSNKGLTTAQVSAHLSIELGRIEYHFDELMRKKLISHPTLRLGGGGGLYPLSQAGRKYVVEILGV